MDELSEARKRRRQAAPLVNAHVAEIADGLASLGGEAHRDLVIDFIAERRGAPRASDALASEFIEAFDLHRTHAEKIAVESLFTLPFGEGSCRWALSRSAKTLLADKQHQQ